MAAMLIGTTAWGQLYVAGHEIDITKTETQTITGSGISGKVTYYPTSKRLVLEDVTITAGENDGIYNKSVDGLYIYFVGSVRITTSSSGTNVAGIYCQGKTYLMPYGNSLHAPTVTVINTGAGPAIKSIEGADVTVYSINLTAAASNHHAIYAQNAARLYVTSSTLTARTADLKCRAITGFTGGLNPNPSARLMEVFNNSSHEFDTASGSVVQNGTPVRNTMLVPSIMIGDLALGNVNEITTTTTGASSVSGSVTFNPDGPIPWLELDGFSMTDKSIVCRLPNLEIRVKGTNFITTTEENAAAIQIYANTTFTGDGTLEVENDGSNSYAISTHNNANVVFHINTLEAKAATCAFYGERTGILTLQEYSKNSIYMFVGGTCNIYTGNLVMNDMDIWTRNTYFDPKEYKMWDASMGRAACGTDIVRDGTCFKSTTEFTHYPIYVGGTQVNSRNCFNVLSQYITGGKVVYDPESQTLTLSDVKIDSEDVFDAIRNEGVDGLEIKMTGESDIKVRDNVFKLYGNTTITGDGTLRGEATADDGYGVWLVGDPNLVLDGPTFEFKGQAAIGGQGDNNLSFNKGKLTFEPNDYPMSAFTALANVDFAANLAITEPEGAYYSKSLEAVTIDGANTYRGLVVVDEKITRYDLTIAGVGVNSVNCTDILHDGVFSYEPVGNTLTISGDCDYEYKTVESRIEDLTINVIGNSTLTAKSGYSIIRLYANTTITGGKLTLKNENKYDQSIGIYLGIEEGVATLTIKDADIEIIGDGFIYGITGEGCSLIIDNSDISVSAHSYGCIYDWSAITLSNCYIEQPEASVIKANGIYGIDDNVIGSGDDTETLVIKAGEMTGIDELGVRNEELGVGNGQSIYDLSGRKVTNPEKGKIYILNGKKVKR